MFESPVTMNTHSSLPGRHMADASLSSHASVAPDRSTLRTEHKHELPGFSPALESEHVLAEVRTTVRAGHLSLDAMLQHIAEAAQMVTCADGAAIAIRRDNLVICQARAGDMAPDLGTKLDTHSGISGQCLRTGEVLGCDDTNNDARVDAEVCRRLGLRSLVVVPVGRKPVVSGVLESFSALPYAFRDAQVELLEELAELVIAAQRHSVESAAQRLREKLANATRQSWLKRRLILAAPIVLILLGWLVFRGRPDSSHSSTAPSQPVTGPVASPVADTSPPVVLKPDSSPAVPARSTKPSLPSGVVMASKTGKADLTEDVIVRKVGSEPASTPNTPVKAPASLTKPPPPNPANAVETAPALAALSAGSETTLGALLSASNNLPQPAFRVSQGLSGGTIERQIKPIYPREALERRFEGRVLLRAVVTEDGWVRDLKVVNGNPLLARAAMEAVAQWRYRPYRLNGKPIQKPTDITLVFKLP
jgi:TonB family protein